jgi:hypothetical protein
MSSWLIVILVFFVGYAFGFLAAFLSCCDDEDEQFWRDWCYSRKKFMDWMENKKDPKEGK